MIRITVNTQNSTATPRINKLKFEKKALQIFNTEIKKQIEIASSKTFNSTKIIFKECQSKQQ